MPIGYIEAHEDPEAAAALVDEGMIDSVIRQLMSGKEAMVFVVRCGAESRCAKVYKKPTSAVPARRSTTPRTAGPRTAARRAIAKGTRFGREAQEKAWQSAEVGPTSMVPTVVSIFLNRNSRALILLAIAAVAGCGGVTTSVPEPSFPAAKHAALDAALTKAMAERRVPGVVVGLWIPGEGTYVVTRGVSELATGKAMQRNDHFRIGSITKTFTVTVLLQLADEKMVGLDDPVSKYVSFVPNGQNINLRMLANMTSGLFSYTEDDAWVTKAFSDFQCTWTPRELVEVGIRHAPNFAPGTGFHYSNTNTVLLGMIIEQVSGKAIQEVYAERLFKPLGLRNTSWPTTSAMPAPYAHGITEQTLDGKQADATHRNPSWAFTAGQLISTVDDLKVWVKSYTTGSLLSQEMQKQRLTYVTFPPNTNQKKYGLGIGNDHGWLGHTGELPGYNTGAYYLPEKDATFVIMVNSDIATDGVNPVPAFVKALAQVVTPENVPE